MRNASSRYPAHSYKHLGFLSIRLTRLDFPLELENTIVTPRKQRFDTTGGCWSAIKKPVSPGGTVGLVVLYTRCLDTTQVKSIPAIDYARPGVVNPYM